MRDQAARFQALRKSIRDTLQAICAFDAACITTIDPATLLSTGSYTDEEIEAIHDKLFQNEFLAQDVHQHQALAKGPIHVASLIQSGDYEKSDRYQHILLPAGWSDELRAALVIQGECWGIASLYRTKEKSPFSEQDIAAVSAKSQELADHIKKELFQKRANEESVHEEQGTLLLSKDSTLLYGNESGYLWLETFQAFEQIHDHTVMPRPFRALCAKLLYENKADTASSMLRIPSGQYLSLHAFQLKSPDGAEPTVMIQMRRAETSEILPYAAKTYGLTEREIDVLDCLLKGKSTKEMAETLFISTHTVHDHVKAMLKKTNLHSRRMLVYFFSNI
ncbi:response regulator transcription factor [Bacillus sp. NPDC077027]|uniref:response regulator transcription factor n=1 Tax=Bacillus sp. NPDC077027 TaxID=3390548 RepID=UPI003CFFC5C3